MKSKPQSTMMDDGKRLHLNHGPIDLIIEAFGEENNVKSAYNRVSHEFDTLLSELVSDLADLRKPIGDQTITISTEIGLRMKEAVFPFSSDFITPMAAVAGSIADHMLCVLCKKNNITKAYINNGGDIAVYLGRGEYFKIGIAEHPLKARLAGIISISDGDGIQGIATSGRHGRSHSLGIADSVTVLAETGAIADAAATMIANAIDLPDSPIVSRLPATELSPDSDLGARLVTVDVGCLSDSDTIKAIEGGYMLAETYRQNGLIKAAWLSLQGLVKIVGHGALLSRCEKNINDVPMIKI